MEVVQVDPDQTHRVSLAPKDRWGIAVAVAAIVVTVVSGIWVAAMNMHEEIGSVKTAVKVVAEQIVGNKAEAKAQFDAVKTEIGAVKGEVTELRTDIREIRTEARERVK